MAKISGHVVFPADAPARRARRVTVEVRDTRLQDVASALLGRVLLDNVAVKPGGRAGFTVETPAEELQGATFRVHVDWDGDGSVAKGDLLTTQLIRVGDDAEVPVTLI